MRLYKQDDGFLEHMVKISTIISLGFGVWAYFSTIHPVFEKEKELQQAKIDNQSLVSTKNELKSQLKTLDSKILEHQKSIGSLNKQESKLIFLVEEKELKIVNSKLGEARTVAVVNKLNYYMDKIINGYLLAITTGKQETFDAVEYAEKLLSTHGSDNNDPYNEEAYVFLKVMS
ncbi:hypothetical protein [Aeromonas eucrenophila]|uniref:Uncharacterized protein n=1 Tax=Aeromonas eucrenophila TaxID=649 RepID=A0ABW0YGD0_9GAMM|nr:hypothetical protein [Aeromonas eucrenophila]